MSFEASRGHAFMGRYVYSCSAAVEFPPILCPPIEDCGSLAKIKSYSYILFLF